MPKKTLPLAEFFELAKIDYKEDLYDCAYYPDNDISASELFEALPRQKELISNDIVK